MEPPQHAVYSSLDELIAQSNTHALTHGYKLVVVRSKTNAAGMKTWVQLACDRHGTKRNTHNLTTETRKKNRRSRRCECPMYCVASKQGQGLWELTVRHGEHNHPPYEATPKKKKSDQPARHSSELINLPLLQTPSHCIADFCLVPIGTGSASVSAEIAEVQRILKRSGLHYEMSSAGTVVEGTWDDVMKIIGQAHSYLHGSGVVRIQTDIRVGSRIDKKQTPQDKINAVNAHLNHEAPQQQPQNQQHQPHEPPHPPPPPPPSSHHSHQQQQPQHDVMAPPEISHEPPRAMRQSLPTNMDSVIAPDLQHVMGPPPPHMQMPPFHPHPMGPPMNPPRLPSTSLPSYSNVNGLQHKG
ncbi:MAG: hypothetical protein Q9162_006131 [Coniocarpon cinnabarinum]